MVFFKKGKFYELYEKDADIGHQVFDLKMTDRVNMRMVNYMAVSFVKFDAYYHVFRLEFRSQVSKNGYGSFGPVEVRD